MERRKLKEARLKKGLREKRKITQLDVAVAIRCSREAYSLWERGGSDPQERWVRELCQYYEVQDPRELGLGPTHEVPNLADIIKMLENYDPHELLAQLQMLPAFAGLDLVTLIEHKFLDQYRVVVNVICCLQHIDTEDACHHASSVSIEME